MESLKPRAQQRSQHPVGPRRQIPKSCLLPLGNTWRNARSRAAWQRGLPRAVGAGMPSARSGEDPAPLHSCRGFCQEAYSGFCGFFLFSWTCSGHCLTNSGLGRDSQDLPWCPGLTLVTVDQIMLQMDSGLETKRPVPAKGSNM